MSPRKRRAPALIMVLLAGFAAGWRPAIAADVSAEGAELLRDVCVPAAQARAIPTSFAIPGDFDRLADGPASPFLEGGAGEVYASRKRGDSAVLALWVDGRCAVYLRNLKDPALEAGNLARVLAAQRLLPVGPPVEERTPRGTLVAVQTYERKDAPPLVGIVTHHGGGGTPGGATATVGPTPPSAPGKN